MIRAPITTLSLAIARWLLSSSAFEWNIRRITAILAICNISLFSSRNNRGSQSRGKLKYTNARQRSIRFTSVCALNARLIAADFNGDLNARDFLSNSHRVQFIPMLWLISNVCRSIKEPVKVIVANGYLVGGCYNVM